MAHTLVAEQDLTDSGTWVQEVDDASLLFVTVTDRGRASVAELFTDPRLKDVGWIAIGHQLPDPPGTIYFEDPIWIWFDRFVVNLESHFVTPDGDVGMNALHYSILNGAAVHVAIYQFS